MERVPALDLKEGYVLAADHVVKSVRRDGDEIVVTDTNDDEIRFSVYQEVIVQRQASS